MNWHAVSMLVVSLFAVWLNSLIPVAILALISFCFLLNIRRRALGLKAWRNQMADGLTLARLVILLFVAALACCLPSLAVFLMFLSNLLLDFVDGRVARATGTASYFGAMFDQEVDAYFVLVACLYFCISKDVGAWILLPGLLRYLYRAVSWARKYAQKDERRNTLLAYLAGLNFSLLTVAVVLPQAIQVAVLVVSPRYS